MIWLSRRRLCCICDRINNKPAEKDLANVWAKISLIENLSSLSSKYRLNVFKSHLLQTVKMHLQSEKGVKYHSNNKTNWVDISKMRYRLSVLLVQTRGITGPFNLSSMLTLYHIYHIHRVFNEAQSHDKIFNLFLSKQQTFLAHLCTKCKVSYCDHILSGVCPACVVNIWAC